MKSQIIPLILFMYTAEAEVFKCQTPEGRVEYQGIPCKKGVEQSKVAIEKIDQHKISQAKEDMAKELRQWDELQKSRADSERQERMLQAMELDVRAKQELIDATRQQTSAIDDNTNAMQNRNYGYRPYYYYRPIAKHYKQGHKNFNNKADRPVPVGDKTIVDRLKIMVK